MTVSQKVIDGLLEDEQIQHVIQGLVIVEVLSPDMDEPTLVLREINDPSLWAAVGLLESAIHLQRSYLLEAFEEPED